MGRVGRGWATTRARRHRVIAPASGLALAALLASACGNGSEQVVRPPTGGTGSATSTARAPSGTTGTPSSVPAVQEITVTPQRDLPARALVRVQASGFTPNQALVVTECAAKSTATGPGDCNLGGIATVASDAHGAVDLRFSVTRGPFGANRITCSATQPCLISVSQATPSPSEEADAPITFR